GPTGRSQLAALLDDYRSLLNRRRDFARAEELLQESLTLSREIADKRSIAAALFTLGWIARCRGDLIVPDNSVKKVCFWTKRWEQRTELLRPSISWESFLNWKGIMSMPWKCIAMPCGCWANLGIRDL